MTSFATEFHAAPEEIISVAHRWLVNLPVFATAEFFPPSRITPLTPENFRETVAASDFREILFTEGPVTRPATSTSQILSEHPGGLLLQVGRLMPRGLEQASLSTMDATPLWKQLNRELKKMTTAGADLVWEDGRTGFDRNARFTAGAKALAATGTPLRMWNQSDYVYLPK